jgi:hypothetical protein
MCFFGGNISEQTFFDDDKLNKSETNSFLPKIFAETSCQMDVRIENYSTNSRVPRKRVLSQLIIIFKR